MGGSYTGTCGTISWPGTVATCTATTATNWVNMATIKAHWKNYIRDDYGGSLSVRTPAKLAPGTNVELPDGARLIIDDLGNYRIEDKDAKVTYKANRLREFSPYMNASDMLAQFVSYVGSLGVKRAEVLGLPIHLFIAWLIIEAAEKDGDQIPSDVIPVRDDPMVRLAIKPKCFSCGRYIKRLHYQNRFPFCSPEHGAAYVSRQTPRIEHRQAV